MPFDRTLFRHKYPYRVRSFHVDRQNVVHNIWYFFFLEEARVEYLRAIGFPVDAETFVKHTRFYVAHNACSYLSASFFDEDLMILTRVSSIGRSSVNFEHIIELADQSRRVAEATHVLVHIDAQTDEPSPLPEQLRRFVSDYEISL